METTPVPSPIPSLTPVPDPTNAPTPVPSSAVPEGSEAPTNPPWQDLFAPSPTPNAMTPSDQLVHATAALEYDGPPKTGKTLRDLSTDLGMTGTLGELLDDMQEAVLGITADLTGKTERKSLGDILAHGNRLRGLGLFLVVGALAGLVIEFVAGESLKAPAVTD